MTISAGRMQPAIDALLAVYNGAPTIGAAIASLQAQTVEDIRIIIVDDGSSDGTAEIVEKMAEADSRILLLREPHGGTVAATNAGLKHCTADYVARMDADDLSDPTRFATQITFLQDHPDHVAVSALGRVIDAAGRLTGDLAKPRPLAESDPDYLPAREPYLMHPLLMTRRSALEAIGGYRHSLHSEDSDLYWRLQEVGRLHNLGEVLGSYRIHANSVTSGSIANARLMAFWSQMSALSAKRRRTGREDFEFSAERAGRSKSCRGMDELFAQCTEQLDPRERAHFRLAFAMKLASLVIMRGHAIEEEDCRFIRRAVDEAYGGLPPRLRLAVKRQVSPLGRYLLSRGQARLARIVVPPRFYLDFAARSAAALPVIRSLRRTLSAAPAA